MKKIILIFVLLVVYTSLCLDTFASITISPPKHELVIEQAEQITKSIKISNESEEAITLYTSGEDFIAWDNTGQPKFIKPEDQEYPELSLSNWIQLDEKNITLSPFETKEVNFTIKVPKNGEPGWHYWAIFFSPWIQNWVKVGFSARIWVLILVNVPWDITINWELEKFELGQEEENKFKEKYNFSSLPIIFNATFQNKWNIHLKPKWKIELLDEEWNTLKNIWKEMIVSKNWAYVWEKLADYIPINSVDWNVLPKSERIFNPRWEWFGHTILNEDGTRSVKFKTIEEYYLNKSSEQQAYLMFWEALHIKKVKKKITAKYNINYTSKDANTKEFTWEKTFYIEYKEKYIWLNYWVIWIILFMIWWWIYFFLYSLPKNRRKKEKEMRKKILKELKK
jgi:hypothetical protein